MNEAQSGQPFLGTLRALSVATREFARFGDCLADGVTIGFDHLTEQQRSVRRSPDRCIIQVGQVAVTVAWIRNRRDSAAGELLIILWRGTVAPAIKQQFERARELSLTAAPLWESVFLPEATCEADWRWHSRDDPTQPYTSSSLAVLVVERLRIAHEAADSRASA